MFKFILKLLKYLRDTEQQGPGEGRALVQGLIDNRDEFNELIEDLREAAGDEKPNETVVKSLHNQLRKQYKPTLSFDQFLGNLKSTLDRQSHLRPNSEQARKYLKTSRKTYYRNLTDWHFHLAIADILLGHYEQLDPIIADQACQMRAPFLLDAIAIVEQEAHNFCKDLEQLDNLRDLALEVHEQGLFYSDNGEELTGSELRHLLANMPTQFKNFCQICRASLALMEGPNEEVFRAVIVKDGKKLELYRTKNIPDETKKKKQQEEKEQSEFELMTWYPAEFNGAHYLRMCKTFTRHREALMDEFGIDVDHVSNPFYDIADKKQWSNVKRFHIPLADFEKQYLAHCSTGYMKYLAQDLANIDVSDVFKDVCTIFNNCTAHTNRSGFFVNLLPVYESFRVLLANAINKEHPIVINLTRLNVENERFLYKKNWILYYEPRNDGQFHYVENPSSEQLSKPAIGIVAASVYNPDMPLNTNIVDDAAFANQSDADLFMDAFKHCDIVHLLMWFALNHPVFPDFSYYNVESVEGEEPKVKLLKGQTAFGRSHLRSLYEALLPLSPLDEDIVFSLRQAPCPLLGQTDMSLVQGFDYYTRLTEALNIDIETVRYAPMTGARPNATWHRNPMTLPFTPTHVYVTTAEREIENRAKLNLEDNQAAEGSFAAEDMVTKSATFGPRYVDLDDEELNDKGKDGDIQFLG